MKIVIPTADYPPIEGGIDTVSLQLSRELAALGHDVTVIAPYFPNMESFDAEEPVSIIRFRGYHLGWFRFLPMFAKATPLIKNADLVLGINIAYGAIMAWLLKRPYLTFAYEFLKFGSGPVASLIKRVYIQSLKTISISGFTTNELERFGIPVSQIQTVLPGAPPAREVPLEKQAAMRKRLALADGPVLLAVGRLIPRKGHATLIEAMLPILAHHPETKLVCVGRGPLQESLETLAQQFTVHHAVRFPGYMNDEDLAALYQLCGLFVLPTGSAKHGQVEGFGLVFAEADAYGKPAIAGRSGGTVDAIIDRKTGILIEPDDPQACAQAVIELLDNPKKARAMGEAGKKRVESKLNWTTFTRKMMEAVEDTL
jgi:phosphatidylinositol alpha-1,6-mannosyltransferase